MMMLAQGQLQPETKLFRRCKILFKEVFNGRSYEREDFVSWNPQFLPLVTKNWRTFLLLLEIIFNFFFNGIRNMEGSDVLQWIIFLKEKFEEPNSLLNKVMSFHFQLLYGDLRWSEDSLKVSTVLQENPWCWYMRNDACSNARARHPPLRKLL